MTLPQKKARVIKVPIVLDSEIELEYVQAKHAVDVRAEELLKTAAERIRIARAAATPDTEHAAAEAVVAKDIAEVEDLQKVVVEKEAALDDVTTYFTFRALGRKTWADVQKRNPPTEEDHAQYAAEGGQGPAPFHELGVARELFHLAAVAPLITQEEAEEIVDGELYNLVEVATLWAGARYVQVQGSAA